MSTPYSPPVGQAPNDPGYNQPLKSTGFGTAALILGIVSIVFSIIPVLGFIAFILGPLAIIFGIIGITRKFTKKGMYITGIILGALSIIIAIIVTVILAAAANSVNETMNKEHKIEYVVTTTGPANVTYSTGDGSSAEDITADWKKEVTATGFSINSLSVIGAAGSDSTVACEILVDGVSVSKNSGTGKGAMTACSATAGAS
jgi:hypothetical protein